MITISASIDGLLKGSIESALKSAEQRINGMKRASDLAKVKTATFVVLDTRDELREQLKLKIDRPTAYTRNSPQIIGANLAKPWAKVYIRDEASGGTPPAKYLMPLAMGGDRRHKRFEKALMSAGYLPEGWFVAPARTARLNKFGNITSGTYTKILSDLRANPDPLQNRTRRKATYFMLWKGDSFAPELLGIYMRRGKKVTKILNFLPPNASPDYARRFDFKKIVEHHALTRAPEILQRVLEKELKNAGR